MEQMSNEEIEALIASDNLGDSTEMGEIKTTKSKRKKPETLEIPVISQEDMDSLLATFVSEEGDSSKESLLDEIHDAILDSGKLTLMQWVKLREKLREIEELIPHIDLIIKLKSKNENKRTDF